MSILLLIVALIIMLRILNWVQCINEDLYDIMKHLKLPVIPRTKGRRHEEITEYINGLVKVGRDKQAILRHLETVSGLIRFGNQSSLGKLKVSSYAKYIDRSIEHLKIYGETISEGAQKSLRASLVRS